MTWFSGLLHDDNSFVSNIKALAYYSDLNEDVFEYYAVRPGYNGLSVGSGLKIASPFEGNICIEEWKYNPFLLTKTKYVDLLSLYLCFRNNPDERIESALEQLINSIQW